MAEYDSIIIGGGHNGLTCGAYLAKQGLRVLVLERREVAGGCCTTEAMPENPGFFVNRGGVDHQHMCSGPVPKELELEKHGLEYLWHEPLWFFPYDDGASWLVWRDVERTCEELAKFAPQEVENYRRWHEFWEHALHLLEAFDVGPPPTMADMLAVTETAEMQELYRALVTPPVVFIDRFFTDDRLKGAMAWWAVQTGTPPTRPGSTLAMGLQSGSHLSGGARPKGGSGALCRALASIIEGAGGTVALNSHVSKVHVANGRATGVTTQDGETFEAGKHVISAIDAKRLFLELMDESDVPSGLLQRVRQVSTTSASLFKVDLALSERPVFERYGGLPEQTLASPIIAPSLSYVMDGWIDIESGRPSREPGLWCACCTALDPSLAPEGKHTLWLSQFAPFHLGEGRSWDGIREETADRAIETFARYAPNVKSAVLGRLITSPLDWRRLTDNTNGCAWHVDMEMHQAWGFRPLPELSQYRTPIPNLYLTGSGSHPGGGITGLPGRNAALEILKDMGQGTPKKGLTGLVREWMGLYRSFRRFRKMTG
ncbi:MAG: NAD(P)/FAD-dependent oxidoreductase [Armatimonadetes bacterium]|nr:NAD(P)/FAD-dependent oxidoreductase [Armatimonadota bacterium]